jgi:hypothetical protein
MPGCCTSEIHLCADVVHFDMQPVDLERIVTRSIRQAIHVPVVGDDGYQEDIDPEDFLDLDVFDEIDPLPVDLSDLDTWDDEPDDEEEEDDDDETEAEEEPEEEDLAQDDGSIVHLWAKRVSGFMFSPGGDLMVEFYDKALQEKAWDMEWMRLIHREGGWDSKARLTRVEARFRRPTLRELRAAFGEREPDWIDDPWKLLDHLQDLWAYAFGMPPEADIPDVAYKGWMRLAVQTEDENRGRWPTDPIWHIIQRAKFNDRPPVPLERHKQQKPDLNRLDAGVYGYIITRVILLGGQMDPTMTFDQAVAAFVADMHERDGNPAATFKPSHFSADVRERARMRGKPLPLLPPRTHAS